jgi:hypothetical protein
MARGTASSRNGWQEERLVAGTDGKRTACSRNGWLEEQLVAETAGNNYNYSWQE